MKRILFIIFILSSIQLFSQSEIWGVKQTSGALGGGFLYTIDSVTQELVVQHRFGSSYFRDRDFDIVTPLVHEQTASIINVADYWLLKYNEITQQTDFRYLNSKAFGGFCEVSDSLWVILKNGGAYKINPYDLSISSIGGFNIHYTTNEVAPVKYSDNELYWNQVVNAYDGAICKLDIEKDEITKVFDFDDYEDANYFPVGRLVKYKSKLYGISYKQDNTLRGFIIFSYHPASGEFKEELFLENKYMQRRYVHGFTEIDGLLYSIGRVKKDDKKNYIFSFNPNNRKIDTLRLLEEDICSSPGTDLFHGPNNILYGSGSDGGENDEGSIFSYNPISNQINALHHFQNDLQTSGVIAKPFTLFNNHVYYFNLSVDSVIRYKLSKLDLISKEEKYVSDLSFLFNADKGSLPQSIVQTSSKKIIGTTLEGGNFSNNSRGSGLIYQFDPLNHRYEVIHTFKDFDHKLIPGDIFLQKNNQLFGVLLSVFNGSYAGKYLLDLNTKEYTRLSDFPWQNSIVSYEMISDSVMYAIVNNIGKKPYSLCRYEVFTDACDTIIYCSENEVINNLEVLNDEEILFQKIIEIDEETDDSYIMKYHIVQNQSEEYINLNHFSNHYGSKERFDYKVRDNGRLMGTFSNNFRSKEAANDEWSYRIGMYDPELDELRILGDSTVFFDSDFFKYCSFSVISSLGNSNQLYAFNEQGSDDAIGEFMLADIPNNQLLLMEHFESFSYYSTGPIYDAIEFPDVKMFQSNTSSHFIWAGRMSNNWYDKENWLRFMVPDSMSTVVIPSLTPYSLEIDTLVKLKNLVVKEMASIEVLINGSMTISNDIYNYGSFKLYACDTASASLIHQKEFLSNNYSSIEYVSDTNVNQTLSIPMNLNEFRFSDFRNIYHLVGDDWSLINQYPFYSNTNKTYLFDQQMTAVQFTGAYHFQDENIRIPLSQERQMYPIPNPYTACSNWDEIDLGSIENKALYRFDKTDSVFVPYIDGLGWETPLVEPLDVVWVYSDGNEEVSFKALNRFHKSQKTISEEVVDNELMLSVSRKEYKDQTIISFNNLSTSDFDGDYDAVKYSKGVLDDPVIFTKTKNEILSINQHPDTSVMDLFVEAGERGEYTIAIDKRKGVDFVMLEDLVWQKRINLLEEDYKFEYFPSDGHYPFKLYFKEWVLEPLEESDFLIYYYPESIYIKSKKQIEEAQIYIYDLAGKLVWDFKAKDFTFFKRQIDLGGGNYILQVRSGDIVKNKMIWVRE